MKDFKSKLPVFYVCPTCGNLVEMIEDSKMPLVCCGNEMKRLNANDTDGATEKHLPVFEIDGDTVTVKVGSEPHPMTKEHHIDWIELVTDKRISRISLEDEPEACACFKVCEGECIVAMYSYCNLHGLWVTFNNC